MEEFNDYAEYPKSIVVAYFRLLVAMKLSQPLTKFLFFAAMVFVHGDTSFGETASPIPPQDKWVDWSDPIEFDEPPLDASSPIRVGYDDGFVISSRRNFDLGDETFPYSLRINGWGQLRHTVLDSRGDNRDLNQLQLKRARLILSGHAFTTDFRYLIQFDGRSSASDQLRILDYYLTYDLGHALWGLDSDTVGFKAGLYKMPFTLARQISGKQFQFADRSMASEFFDVNRSLAWGLYGKTSGLEKPIYWEMALFNGLVTGGADTGSSGTLDNNNAIATRLTWYPLDHWGAGDLADFDIHQSLAMRFGAGVAFTDIERIGSTEFSSVRVADSGQTLASLMPLRVNEYSVALYAMDASLKYQGLSLASEYYFRNLSGFNGQFPDLFDFGFWLQAGMFVVPEKFELLARWSRVNGNSGTLGGADQSSDEMAVGVARYFRDQNAKLTIDATYLNGATVNSSALDISPGDLGWLFRTQLQFSF